MYTKKKVQIKDIKSDVLPEVADIIGNETKRKKKYWGDTFSKAIVKPQTNEDLLILGLEDLRETSLRIEAMIMRKKLGKGLPPIPLDYYVNFFKEHIGRAINYLEDMGFDMKTPPTPR